MGSAVKIIMIYSSLGKCNEIDRYLRTCGCDTVSEIVKTGSNLARLLADKDWDLIISDYANESLDALTALRILKESRKNIPFIIMSNNISENEAIEAMQRGARDCLNKEQLGRLLPVIERELCDYQIQREIRKKENELKESKKRLSDIINFLPDATFAIDKEGKVIIWNHAIEELTGVRAAEIMGKGDYEYALPFYGKRRPLIVDLVLKPDETAESGYYIMEKRKETIIAEAHANYLPGKNVYIWTKASPLYDSDGNITGAIESVRDISHHKQDEEEIKESMENLKRTLEGAVNALAVISEKRDACTAGHQQRTARLATMIAQEMGLSAEDIEGIRTAGILHDIGKIYIPAEILGKPGKINEFEMALIKTHPQVGYEIIKTIPFKWPVAQVVLQHHERINGRGYPSCLAKDEILLEARILAVADVIEAMVSHRPYRPSLGLELAIEEIVSNKGKLYDPDVVEATMGIYKSQKINLVS